MAKPDPALLDPARYPFSCSVETRFADLDINQHVNNVALVGLLEEGRVRCQRAVGNDVQAMDMAPMVVSLAVEFLGQTYFPDPIELHVASGPLGRTSYTLYQLATQGGRIVAFAQVTIVNTSEGGPSELPPVFREGLRAWSLKA